MPINLGPRANSIHRGVVEVLTPKRSLASATDRAMGPRDCMTVASTSSLGIRAGVGRKPTTPQHDAGMRIEPPVSPPSATVAMPAATAAALPPLEPPGVMPSRQGFCVAGNRVLVVPIAAASSGMLVLPRIAIPAALARSTATASSVAIRSFQEGVAYV